MLYFIGFCIVAWILFHIPAWIGGVLGIIFFVINAFWLIWRIAKNRKDLAVGIYWNLLAMIGSGIWTWFMFR